MDINSLVSQYLSNNKDVSLSDIQSALNNLRVSYYDFDNDCINVDSDTSIFTMGNSDTITQEEFLDIMVKATGKSESEIKDDVSLLFDIMDNEADGKGSLSKSEFSLFLDGDNVTSFSIWAHLGLEEDRVKISSTSSSSTDDTNGSDSQTGNSNASAGTDGTSETTGTDTQNDSSNQSSSSGLNLNDPESIKNFLKDLAIGDYKNATNEELLVFCVEQGLLSEEDADTARNTFKLESLSAKDRSAVQKLIDSGNTLDEAVKKLGLTLDSDNSLNQKANQEINYEEWADQLDNAMKGKFDGTDEDTLMSILNDGSITNDDFVKIVEAYENKYGTGAGKDGLVTRLERETSGDLQKQLTSILGQRLLMAAEDGNDDAIKLICKEVYSGTAGQNCTADDLLNAIFLSGVSDETLYKINEEYSKVNSGHDLITDIKNDHGGFLNWRNWGFNVGASGKGQDIITRIEEALRHHKTS